MTNLFNNREIATGIWLVIAAVWFGKNVGVREAVSRMLKMFLEPKIAVPILLMAGYLWLGVLLLSRLHLWNGSLLKDTIYWFLLTGFVLFMNIMGNKEPIPFLKKTVVRCVAVTVFIEFLLNLYAFPLLGELVLIPVLAFLGAASVITENKPEYASVRQLFDGIQSIIGILLVGYVIRIIYLHHSELISRDVLISILLPILLTILFLPFLYLSKLVADYELLFLHLKHAIPQDKRLLSTVRRNAIVLCHVNLVRLNRFKSVAFPRLWCAADKQAVAQLISDFKSGQINEN